MPYAIYYEGCFYLITLFMILALCLKPSKTTLLLPMPELVMNGCLLFYNGILADECSWQMSSLPMYLSILHLFFYVGIIWRYIRIHQFA